MASREEALTVIEKYDSHDLMGRIILVEFAKDIKKSSPLTPIPSENRAKLYVSNLEWKVRAKNLREFFGVDFNPISTRVVFESPSGRSAGYGFVTFASKDEAESAISALDGKNETLIVIKAPHGTTLEVPDPDEAVDYPQRRYRIILRSTMGPIDVYLVRS